MKTEIELVNIGVEVNGAHIVKFAREGELDSLKDESGTYHCEICESENNGVMYHTYYRNQNNRGSLAKIGQTSKYEVIRCACEDCVHDINKTARLNKVLDPIVENKKFSIIVNFNSDVVGQKIAFSSIEKFSEWARLNASDVSNSSVNTSASFTVDFVKVVN